MIADFFSILFVKQSPYKMLTNVVVMVIPLKLVIF